MKKYIRDGRAPIPEEESISKVMSAIKAKNTRPERLLCKYLEEHGLKNFQRNVRDLPGTPDVCFMDKKLAIFIHGCFWHGCPHCNLKQPKTHTDFWKNKIIKNKERDKQKTAELMDLGWEVMEIWECELKKDISSFLLDVTNIYHGLY
jgi:DNA mismatch endonuclease (patch repair protein)